MGTPESYHGVRSRKPNVPVAAYITFQIQLGHLHKYVAEVRDYQTEIEALLDTAKLNTTEWSDAKSRIRLATIRSRHCLTRTKKVWREVAEALRRNLYDDSVKPEAQRLFQEAEAYFDLLHAQGF